MPEAGDITPHLYGPCDQGSFDLKDHVLEVIAPDIIEDQQKSTTSQAPIQRDRLFLPKGYDTRLHD